MLLTLKMKAPISKHTAPPAVVNVMTNGSFSSDTVWNKGAGWTIAGGVAVGTASSAALTNAGILTSTVRYLVTYTITVAAGSVVVKCGTQAGVARTQSGTYVEYLTANGTGFSFTGTSFTGTIDNVSAEA